MDYLENLNMQSEISSLKRKLEESEEPSSSTHGAIIYGEIRRKIYYGAHIYSREGSITKVVDMSICEGSEFVEYKEIFRGDIRNPSLSGTIKLNIEDEKTAYIKDKVRDIKGNFLYYTNYIIETVEDEKTTKSFEKFNNEKDELCRRANERLRNGFEDFITDEVVTKENFWKRLVNIIFNGKGR